ncbi:MAG: metal ABC transporter ATP-binding protein, partial [Candidatus Sericytochromatia bacterium]
MNAFNRALNWPQKGARASVGLADAHGTSIAVEGLTAGYLGVDVLDHVAFRLPTGCMTGVVGPNGAGKSTLLKAILGLLDRATGEVALLGGTLAERRNRVAYVPQRSSVDWDFPATVLDVVAMGRYGRLPWWRWPGRAEKDAAMEALKRVGMDAYADRRISDLSGGQQQRVFLARALAQEAELYLLDEPLAGIDATSEAVIIGLLKQIAQDGGTVVAVHHDLATAPRYFDQLLLVNRRVVACGPTAETFTAEKLQETYGSQLLTLDGQTAMIVEG